MESLYARREEHTEGRNKRRGTLSAGPPTRDKEDGARDSRGQLPRLLRGHKLYSSNVNINETNELSVMSVMTVDCCRNKRSAGFHVVVVTTRRGNPRCYYIVSMNVYISGTLAMRYASFIDCIKKREDVVSFDFFDFFFFFF